MTDAAFVDLDPTMSSLGGNRLPAYAAGLVMVIAFALSGLIVLVLGWGVVAFGILGVLFSVIGFPVWSLAVENRRAATDRFVTSLIWAAFAVALVPLIWLLSLVISKGVPGISWTFLSTDGVQRLNAQGILSTGGGVLAALVGTLLITLGAAIISVPVGLFTAVYLVEYGRKSRMARVITFLVDVMTGIPSIVAGLFALALFTLIFGVAFRSGLMGSVALSLLMIPTVVRSAEEMMRLVPADLREASYALGVSKWRPLVKIVIPTSLGGIITGVMLAISRVIGETAPLLVAVGTLDSVNHNLFSGRMMTLPVYIYNEYSKSTTQGYANAWAGALILIIFVMVLNLLARVIGKIFAPASER
jgi:phosphate transport system permease protein